MENRKEVIRWIIAGALVIASLLFAVRMVVIWRDVDASTGLFRTGDSSFCALYNVTSVLLLVGALAAALAAGRMWRKNGPPAPKGDPVREAMRRNDPFFSELDDYDDEEESEDYADPQTAAAAASTWEGTLSAFSYLLPGFGFLFFALSFVLQGGRDLLTVLFCMISAACGLYFLIAGLRNSPDKSVPFAFAGLTPAVWAALRMIIEYRDVEKYANRGMYTANLIFLVAVVCFFVYQSQVALGNESYAMPLSWFATALLVVIFGLSARLPQLLGLVFDRLGKMDLVDAASLLLDLALALFAGLKLRRMAR